MNPIIEIHHLQKFFGEVHAVQDLTNLDDPDTPQGNLDIGDVDGNNTSSDASRFPFIVGIVGGVVGVVAILMLALLLIRKGVKMANGDQKKR